MNRWMNKIFLVTGASSGIGLEICKVLAKEGMRVVGCARRVDRLNKLSKEILSNGGNFTAITCDLSKEEDIYSLFTRIQENFGGVDVCVNNAAFSYGVSLMDGKVSEWKKTIDVNMIATCLCTQLSIKSMRERNFDTGHIININSITGHKVISSNSGHFYSATKFGVTSLTEGFRQELREMKSHIRITSLCPGVVETEFEFVRQNEESAKLLYSKMECLQSVDIAKVVIDVLTSHPRAEISEIKIRPTEQIF